MQASKAMLGRGSILFPVVTKNMMQASKAMQGRSRGNIFFLVVTKTKLVHDASF